MLRLEKSEIFMNSWEFFVFTLVFFFLLWYTFKVRKKAEQYNYFTHFTALFRRCGQFVRCGKGKMEEKPRRKKTWQ